MVVFLRFVMSLISRVLQVTFPVGDVMSGAVVMGLNCVVMTVSVMNGHLFDFIVAMVVMVWVRCANLFWMGVVVSSLCHNVVLFRSGDSEVKRLMLFILVMISIILVSVCVL